MRQGLAGLILLVSSGLLAAAASEENQYMDDLSRYEKEVRLVCETSLKDPSAARQTVAKSTLERLNLKMAEIQKKVERANQRIEELGNSKKPPTEEALKKAREEYSLAMKHYQSTFADGNLGRQSSAATEEELGKVRETRRQLEELEAEAKAKQTGPIAQKSPESGTEPEKKEKMDLAYKDLENLVEASDKYQALQRKATDCAYRQNNIGKPATEDTSEVPTTSFKKPGGEVKF